MLLLSSGFADLAAYCPEEQCFYRGSENSATALEGGAANWSFGLLMLLQPK